MFTQKDARRRLEWCLLCIVLGGLLLTPLAWGLGPPPDKDEDDKVPDVTGPDVRQTPPPQLRKLTAREINRIRYMELRGMRLLTDQPDRVSVKIPRETVDEFLLEMEGHPDFRGEKTRRAFRKLTAPQKLHEIARYKGAAYAGKVQVKSDPEVFVQFRRHVLPIVLNGCATAKCHASTNDEAGRFRLFRDPKKQPGTTYANFIMLHDMHVGPYRMIDRGQPEKSLLLTYMLPKEEVRPALRHPGEVAVKPVFRSRRPLGYQRIQAWIESLKHPAEDYGVHMIPPPRLDDIAPDESLRDPP